MVWSAPAAVEEAASPHLATSDPSLFLHLLNTSALTRCAAIRLNHRAGS